MIPEKEEKIITSIDFTEKEPYESEDIVEFPKSIRCAKDLKPGEKIFLMEIKAIHQKNGDVPYTCARLAEHLGVSVITIHQYVRRLVERGYLKIEAKYLDGKVVKSLILN